MPITGLHAAIIMDGNGRWAEKRGLPRVAGHVEGERTLRRIAKAAPECGVETLTVYAFSSDNWKRPPEEVTGLMTLLQTHLARSAAQCRRDGVRLSVIGRRDRIPQAAANAIEIAEDETRAGSRLHLRIAVDYSSRDALLSACARASRLDRAAVSGMLGGRDVDLLIRTGGEQRLSDFLLWECAYAELFFSPSLWPDFAPAEFEQIVADFRRRDRRYGGLSRSGTEAFVV